MGRFLAALLVKALRSEAVQTAALETTRYLARRGTAFILKKLRASSKTFRD